MILLSRYLLLIRWDILRGWRSRRGLIGEDLVGLIEILFIKNLFLFIIACGYWQSKSDLYVFQYLEYFSLFFQQMGTEIIAYIVILSLALFFAYFFLNKLRSIHVDQNHIKWRIGVKIHILWLIIWIYIMTEIKF